MKKKANRLDAIKMIISSKEVGSQEELLQELNREGFELTQATLSRDLKPLSAPAQVTPAVWLTISTTMNSAKYWEPLPAMILSCWCCVKELRQARFASFCHSSFRTLNNYTYLYI